MDKDDSAAPGKEVEFNLSELWRELRDSKSKGYFYWIGLVGLLITSLYIRTRNLKLLQGKYLLGLDPYLFYRHARTIVENGVLPAVDVMRAGPIDTPLGATSYPFAYFLAYYYKIVGFVVPTVSQLEAHIWYPAIASVFIFLFFFLFVKELFDEQVALLSTAIFVVIPTFLYRTMAGFADHEALAMVFTFASLWMFAKFMSESDYKRRLIYVFLSAVIGFLMALVWSGYPLFVIPICGFIFFKLVSGTLENREINCYLIWLVVFGGLFGIIKNLDALFGARTLPVVLSIVFLVLYRIIKKLKISVRVTDNFKLDAVSLSVGIPVVLGVVANFFLKIVSLDSLTPIRSTRVQKTISEIIGSTHFWQNFNWTMLGVIAGVVLIVFLLTKDKKIKIISTVSSFILVSMMCLVSISSRAQLILFAIFTLGLVALAYNHQYIYKDRIYLILPLMLILVNIYLGGVAARFLFTLSPFVALMCGYSVIKIAGWMSSKKNNEFKLGAIILILVVLYLTFGLAQSSLVQAERSGSGLPGQWNDAMTWIRENTEEDAIVTHWWDYGYWTQAVGERRSTHDGGRQRIKTLQPLGRYAMTGVEDKNVFDYLHTWNVSYLLYSEEEIGKYHAFSFIGSESDDNLDRESTIGIFQLQKIGEVRDGEQYVYGGQWVFDQDMIIDRQVLPKRQSAIVGFKLRKEGVEFKEPRAIIYYQGRQIEKNIGCLIIDGRRIEREVNNSIGGCIGFVPQFKQNGAMQNPYGGIIYASDKVKDGLYARLYLFGQDVEGFEEVYSDNTPLAVMQGRSVIGPVKIWNVSYPEDVEVHQEWLS